MTLIKVSNLRLRFEHTIALNRGKKYKLGVSHLMFSLEQTFNIIDFEFHFKIPIPTTDASSIIKKNCINGVFTIITLQTEIQNYIITTYNKTVEHLEKIIKKILLINEKHYKYLLLNLSH